MIEIVPMAEEHINGVVTLEEATFSIPGPERILKEKSEKTQWRFTMWR